MTQIKKTLSIVGIIALATAPAMADIASTQYVQSIVNSINIPTYTAGNGISINNNAISVTDNVLTNKTKYPDYQLAIGGAEVNDGSSVYDGEFSLAIGNATASIGSIAIANADVDFGDEFGHVEGVSEKASATNYGIAIGERSKADSGVAIGGRADATGGEATAIGIGARATGEMSTAVGNGAIATGYTSIQLGGGRNTVPGTFSVSLWREDDIGGDYRLLKFDGSIPAGRMVAGIWDDDEGVYVDNNGVSGQLLQTNGDGTMSWVNAPSAPTLASLLPELPSECNTVKCALVHDNTDGAYKWEVVKVSE